MATVIQTKRLKEAASVDNAGASVSVGVPFKTSAASGVITRTVSASAGTGTLATDTLTITNRLPKAGCTVAVVSTHTMGATPDSTITLTPKPAAITSVKRDGVAIDSGDYSYVAGTGVLTISGATPLEGEEIEVTYSLTWVSGTTIQSNGSNSDPDSIAITLTGDVTISGLTFTLDAANFDVAITGTSGEVALLKNDSVALTLTNDMSFALVTTT